MAIYKSTQNYLYIPGEVGWIQHRKQVMLNETTRVTSLTCHLPELLLQRSEWAHSPLVFNQCSPYCGRKV